ncbi:MAG: hypothetical protein ACK5KP_09695 [Paludibacteraceae bacterium]
MKKSIFLLLFFGIISGSAIVARNTLRDDIGLDTVVYLKEIVVYPEKQKYKSITPKIKRIPNLSISYAVYGSFVSRVPLEKEKTYRIMGVVFYFNAEGKNNGFYVHPLVYSSKDNRPNEDLLKDSPVYFVDKKVKNQVYFDLSAYNLVFNGSSEFFLGMNFPGIKKDIDMSNLYIKGGYSNKKDLLSYIKKRCYECPQTSFSRLEIPKSKEDVTLKYKLYYTEVKDEE